MKPAIRTICLGILALLFAFVPADLLSQPLAAGRSNAPSASVCTAPTFFGLRRYFFEEYPDPIYLTIADVNHDDHADIISAGGYIVAPIMRGIGTSGGFLPEINLEVGQARELTTGDVNNDGNVDIIVTQLGSVGIYLGDGTGTAWTPIPYNPAPAGDNVFLSKTIAKDLNGDGNLDLLVSTSSFSSPTIYVRFGNGNGTFAATQNLNAAGGSYIYAEDINNDGHTDIVASYDLDHQSKIFLGLPNGTFGPGTAGPPLPTFDLQFIDLNSDGYKDIVAAYSNFYTFYNNHVGNFAPAVITPLIPSDGTTLQSGQVADFDGDGIMDVALVTGPPQIHIFKGLSPTSFQETQVTALPGTGRELRIADLNNDGKPDISFLGEDTESAYTLINKCGDTGPRYSIFGSMFNNEGYYINGALVTLESPESGTLSATAGSGQSFEFTDLPANGHYTVTPAHSLFEFSPSSIQIDGLTSNQSIQFEGTIRHFRIYGRVYDYCCTGQSIAAANVPMRLIGPFTFPFSTLSAPGEFTSPEVDVHLRTDANGNYEFKDLLPIDGSQIYQVIFEDDTIWHGITPIYAFRGLVSDQNRSFYAGRNVYSLGVHLTTPNGQPRSGVAFYLVQPQGYPERHLVTDANGRGSIGDLVAGLSHSFVKTIPSYRHTPDPVTTSYLTANTEVETRISLQNRNDFDNDGKSDLAVWRPSTGTWYVQQSTDNRFWGINFGLSTDVPAPGDYDGDQKTDIAVYRPSDGNWYIMSSGSGTFTTFHFGISGDIPVPVDLDRDGKTDVNVFRPSTGTWYDFQSYYQSMIVTSWGLPGDLPLVGDFDGDTYFDLTIYRPSNGTWYILKSGGGSGAVQFGLSTDRVMTGDFDGDTISDIAVWRPSTGIWYIQKSSDGGYKIAQFGLNGDVPLAGDFDGDGINDLSVYRPSDHLWYVLNSSDGQYSARSFGLLDDVPVPSMIVK